MPNSGFNRDTNIRNEKSSPKRKFWGLISRGRPRRYPGGRSKSWKKQAFRCRHPYRHAVYHSVKIPRLTSLALLASFIVCLRPFTSLAAWVLFEFLVCFCKIQQISLSKSRWVSGGIILFGEEKSLGGSRWVSVSLGEFEGVRRDGFFGCFCFNFCSFGMMGAVLQGVWCSFASFGLVFAKYHSILGV